MSRFARPAALVGFLTLAAALAVAWVEAGKEVRVLCAQFAPGVHLSDVVRQLETGAFLRYTLRSDGPAQSVEVSSPYTLGGSRCSVSLAARVVLEGRYEDRRTVRLAAVVAAAGFAWLVVFQLALALGAPLGHLAWGGRHRRLPPPLRLASLAAAGLVAFGAVCVLERAGVVHTLGRPRLVGAAVWALAGLFALSTAGNLASSSTRERRLGVPVALVLCAACLVVAWWG